MAPKKKSGRNAFYYFLMEMRDHNRNKSNQELQDYAGAKWNNMTKEQRKVYEDRAALLKNNPSGSKYTSDGKNIDSMQQRVQEQESALQRAKQETQHRLLTAQEKGVVDQEVFLIVHVNKLVYYPKDDRYFACEVAIAAFSLKDGVKEVLHRIVKPGKLPLGFFGDARIYSKQSHQLIDVIYEGESYDDNTDLVFDEILDFMHNHKKGPKFPALHTTARDLEMVQNIFRNWCLDFNFEPTINVHELEILFQMLKNTAAGKVVWESDSMSASSLERDSFSHVSDISCDYHEQTDNTVYCSKSVVTRYVYIICDCCCHHLNIQLVPGRHVPKGATVRNVGAANPNQSRSLFEDFRPNAASSETGWSNVSDTADQLQWMTVSGRRPNSNRK